MQLSKSDKTFSVNWFKVVKWATCTVHSISAQPSQEGIKHTKAKKKLGLSYCPNIYTVITENWLNQLKFWLTREQTLTWFPEQWTIPMSMIPFLLLPLKITTWKLSNFCWPKEPNMMSNACPGNFFFVFKFFWEISHCLLFTFTE